LRDARLHFVTGKGGTGKSTIAAALALALAAGGRKILLIEVEGRQGIAQLFDVPPLPYQEVKIATAERGGEVNALAIDIEAAYRRKRRRGQRAGHRHRGGVPRIP
jgi:anion-transporting  ArsA/GET3 family ATPase